MTLDFISATPYLIDVLSEPAYSQEEARQSWIMVYHFIKNCLIESEKEKSDGGGKNEV